jgi:hypothetical protein
MGVPLRPKIYSPQRRQSILPAVRGMEEAMD